MLRGSDVKDRFGRLEIPTEIHEIGGELEYLPAKVETEQHPGDVFEHTWSGGGGFGDPIDRDPGLVYADVQTGAVSERAAREIYGVALNGAGPDLEETDNLRKEIRRERLS
jgi:N-methylhydantoinase B